MEKTVIFEEKDFDFKKVKILPESFYQKDTITIARNLLGKLLVRKFKNQILVGRIIETEAYLPDDEASHSFGGLTKRNTSMFMSAGTSYVYLIYGMYYCFNVVTEKQGTGAAVLVRALEPLYGLKLMMKNRNTKKISNLCSGPGKLCEAFLIDKSLDGIQLWNSKELFLVDDGTKIDFKKIKQTPRIGISKNKDKEWRFLLEITKNTL
jgi:DNA-3-methyladenine glycosylase